MAATPWEWEQRKERSSTWPTPTPEEVMVDHTTPLYFTAEPTHNGVSPHFMELSSPEFDATLHRHEEKPPSLSVSPEVARSTRPSCASGTPEAKKPRNPWGEMSYADLITKAILSTLDKRLTLSEIYTWMIENVPYFHEKANETSTSGWKNSIRHNLSLHDRFVKVPNEKTGKSNWWTVNLDAKGNKSSRRPRSSSIDTPTTPKPKSDKKKRTKKLPVQKSLSVDTSARVSSCVSPCDSPTTPHMQQWSPLPTSPAPSTPLEFQPNTSPVLSRSSRALPSSPLLSPVQFSPTPSNLRPRNFHGSNNSLTDADQRDEAYNTQASSDSLNYENHSQNVFSQPPVHDGYGSSSSLSSLNSPLARLSVTGQTVFTFPAVTMGGSSSCTSPAHQLSSGISSGIPSDIEMGYRQDSPVQSSPPPPTYEEAIQQGVAPLKHPLTMQHSFPQHPLHISNHFKRPRSTSMPIAIEQHERFPSDLDMNLFQHHTSFNIDVSKVLRSELEMGGGPLDFGNVEMGGNCGMGNSPLVEASGDAQGECPSLLEGQLMIKEEPGPLSGVGSHVTSYGLQGW